MSTNIENLSYIPSGEPEAKTIDLFYSRHMLDLINSVKERFDIIIFDTPPINVFVDASIIASKTDEAILVAKQRITTTIYIQNAKKRLENAGAKLAGIIINQVDKSEYKRYLKQYNYLFNKLK